MINITKSDEIIEVKNICFTIYSQPGLGKTSLAFTASNPLMLDFDRGAYRAVDRGDVVQVENWDDVAGIKEADIAQYDTIIIDTVGKALECLSANIIKANPKYGYGGALSQQGWGQLGIKFGAFLKLLKSFGKDVVMIAHMDEKHDGDSIKERLAIQGGTKNLVLTDSDVIARISVSNRERALVFSPTETSFGKDPAALDSLSIPHAPSEAFAGFLDGVIGQVKEGLNKLSAAQVVRKGEVDWFREQLPLMDTPDEINAVIGRSKSAGRDVQMMVVARARELGLDFDPEAREYTYGEPDPSAVDPDKEPVSDEEAA